MDQGAVRGDFTPLNKCCCEEFWQRESRQSRPDSLVVWDESPWDLINLWEGFWNKLLSELSHPIFWVMVVVFFCALVLSGILFFPNVCACYIKKEKKSQTQLKSCLFWQWSLGILLLLFEDSILLQWQSAAVSLLSQWAEIFQATEYFSAEEAEGKTRGCKRSHARVFLVLNCIDCRRCSWTGSSWLVFVHHRTNFLL